MTTDNRCWGAVLHMEGKQMKKSQLFKIVVN